MKFNKIIKIFLVIFVLGLSFFLRYKNFGQVPVAGTSMDEYSYSWVGLSLIQNHYPIGISNIAGYKNNDQKYVNPDDLLHIAVSGPFVFNYPWFDHPPLLGLITGGYSYFRGARNFEDIHLHVIRQPMIALGTLGVLLVFIFAYINFGYLPAIISASIYGIAPLSVIGSRMIQGENGMIIPYFISLIFISLYLKNKNNFCLFLSASFCGLAMLFKLSGVVAVISVIALIIFSKSKNNKEKILDIFIVSVISSLFLSLFFIYGYYFDWSVFKNIVLSNVNRFYGIGPNSLFNLITQVKLTGDKNLSDGWVLIGWTCFFLNLNTKDSKRYFLSLPIISYLIVYIFFGSQNYGWYMFPFLPFLALNIGYQFKKILDNNQILSGVLLELIAIGAGIFSLVNITKFQDYSKIWRIVLPLIIISALFLNNKKTGKFLLIILFLIGLILNIFFVKNLDITSWYANVW